jgi:hypothetical protein
MLGRQTEAKATITEALKRFPSLTIESMISDPLFSEVEHQRHLEAMRKVGFPACAGREELAKYPKPNRLPECLANQ